jgi:hypothetical protein
MVVAVAPGVRVTVPGLVVADRPGAVGTTEAVTLTAPVRPMLVTDTIVDDGGEPAVKAGIVLVEMDTSQTLTVTVAERTSVPLVPVTVTR